MKSMKLKTKEIVDAFKILDQAKYQKLSDEDKVRVWKITRKLGPIAGKFNEEKEDAEKKLIPYENFFDEVQKALKYQGLVEKGVKDNLPLTEEQHKKITQDWNNYQLLVIKATKELNDKEEDIEFEPITEDAFGCLMNSNDWTFGQAGVLEFIMS